MGRKLQLDGLRGIAVIMVFFYHAFDAPLMWFGVDLFFVLSGYLITGILLRMKERKLGVGSALRSFYSRRACRILPPFLLFMLVVTAAFHIHWSHLWYWYAFFDANLAFAFGKVAYWALAPLWSLAVEEQFYFVWPWVVLFCSEKTLKRVLLGIIVLAPIFRAFCTPFAPRDFVYAFTLSRLDGLAMGAAIAVVEHENPVCFRSRHRLAVICAVSSWVILCALSSLPMFRRSAHSIFFNSLGYSLIGLVFGATVFYALGSYLGIAHSILTLKPLCYMGRISYTFYLYHLGVLLLIREHFHSSFLVALMAFGITAALAALSWPLFESPILRLQRRVSGDEPQESYNLLAGEGVRYAFFLQQ